MNRILFFFLTLNASAVFAQNNTEYTIYGIYNYDSVGNQYQVIKKFDHPPTHEDSIAFYAAERDEINKLMRDAEMEKVRTDSIYRSQLKKQPVKKKHISQKTGRHQTPTY